MEGNSIPHSKALTKTVANIARNESLQKAAQQNNLNIYELTWEDTARDKNSCLGPNISDVTLRLDKDDILLPVIRRPNFSDETADFPIGHFTLTVGNETPGSPLKQVTLKEYLENKDGYIKDVNGTPVKSLLCPERDSMILTCAQYCILPLHQGSCEFNVHLYNYQSSSTEPGVLVIVASATGSSAQAIYDGTTVLYFNKAGKAANYVAERLKAERERLGKATEGKMDEDEQARNVLFIYQIPLKNENKIKIVNFGFGGMLLKERVFCDAPGATNSLGMDNAVLSVGETHSDFQGITSANIERDPQFPIRCTIQYYKVTDEENVPAEEFKDMAQNIEKLYKSAENAGSLVVENSDRKTEWVKGN